MSDSSAAFIVVGRRKILQSPITGEARQFFRLRRRLDGNAKQRDCSATAAKTIPVLENIIQYCASQVSRDFVDGSRQHTPR
jgi:hypothetical protein